MVYVVLDSGMVGKKHGGFIRVAQGLIESQGHLPLLLFSKLNLDARCGGY